MWHRRVRGFFSLEKKTEKQADKKKTKGKKTAE
jgi:ribosomal protein L13E